MGDQKTGKNYMCEWVLIAIGFLIMIVFGMWKPESLKESHDVWYQRSGAIAVLCSLLVEFRINFRALLEKHFSKNTSSDCTISQQIDNWHAKGYPVGRLHQIALSLATVGTVTCAYGDLLYGLVK